MRAEFFGLKRKEFSGKDAENDLIGHSIDWSLILEKEGINPEKFGIHDWIKIFEKHYPLNPKLPQKKCWRDVFDITAEKLNLDPDEQEGLYFFNTLGSGLDNKGIDCLFLFKNLKAKTSALFTIDVTMNQNKDSWRADDIVSRNDFPDHNLEPEKYMEKINEKAEKISRRLVEKTWVINRQNKRTGEIEKLKK